MIQKLTLPLVCLASVLAVGLSVAWPALADEANGPSIRGNYVFRMTPAKSLSANAPADPAGIAGAPRQDVLRVGVMTADGAGNLTGHTLATTDNNQGQTWLVSFDWTGKYVMNANGTGFFSVDVISNIGCTDMTVNHAGPSPHPAATGGTPSRNNVSCPTGDTAIEGHEDYAFVFSTPGGKKFEFIQTDNAGGGAKIFMTGTATRQEDAGRSDGGPPPHGHNR
ncbi:MAG: hypothetical protein HYX25_03615 [Candidatus Solibacter usitatus]|nr:hypothetical protein [Candidatus Solibacter usitatus]